MGTRGNGTEAEGKLAALVGRYMRRRTVTSLLSIRLEKPAETLLACV